MTWSFAAARQAAAAVRAAERGPQAVATIRRRGVIGLIRSRAPLPLLLYVASRDGLVVEQDGGGYAVLQPPLIRGPDRSGARGLRCLRWLDRHWDLAVFAAPPLLGILVGAFAVPLPGVRPAGIAVLLLGMLWISVLLTAMLIYQLRWVAQLGAPSTRARGRAAESLRGDHWSVPLVHQPDPERVDELIRLLTERLVRLIGAGAQNWVGDKARIATPQVTETLIVITTGISTEQTRAAMARSLWAIQDYPGAGDVIVLAPPSRLEAVPRQHLTGGGFLALYLGGLAVVIAVCARLVADTESAACTATSCTGRPVTYSSALRWLLQRLLFSDPSGLAPATNRAVVLGWLVSIAAAMLLAVALVAAQQEIAGNRLARDYHRSALERVTQAARVLILVVTDDERKAVTAAMRQRTGKVAVDDQTGTRTGQVLGRLGNTEIVLAQAGEQGTLTASGMLVSAGRLISHFRPDYVILTGICYGLRPDEGQRLGDVVVARRVQGVDHRKVTDGRVIHRGVNVGSSPELLDRFQAGQSTWSGSARIHVGTMLASNTVVNSKQLVRQLREQFPDAIAGEMEGTGVYEAAIEDVKPDWIIVKGVSDWGYDKNDHYQPVAAANAAEFVIHVIVGSGLRPRRS